MTTTSENKVWSGGSVWFFIKEIERYTKGMTKPIEFAVGVIVEILNRKKIKIKLSDSSIVYADVGSTQTVRVGGLVLLFVRESVNGRKTYVVQDIKYVASGDAKNYSV